MGTHPIFESDFDCLTDCERNRFKNSNLLLTTTITTRHQQHQLTLTDETTEGIKQEESS